MGVVCHITPHEAWEAGLAAGVYRDASLDAQGFIHCSTPEQVVPVANAIFRGQAGLALLCIAPEKLAAPLVYEPSPEDPTCGQRFPHLYGPLNLDAVIAVLDFPPNPDGSFRLPERIAALR